MIGIIGWIFGAVGLNILGARISVLGEKFHYWNRFYNPFILALSYGAMILGESSKEFISKSINWISGLSLYIYMITGNQLIRVYLDNQIYDQVCGLLGCSSKICVAFVVIYAFIKTIFGILLSVAYMKTLGKLVAKVSEIECNKIQRIIEKIPVD